MIPVVGIFRKGQHKGKEQNRASQSAGERGGGGEENKGQRIFQSMKLY